MVLVIHITIAIASVLSSLLSVLFPTKSRLFLTQLLTLATFTSGAALVITHPANLGKSCVSGILYLGFISLTSAISRNKFADMKGSSL